MGKVPTEDVDEKIHLVKFFETLKLGNEIGIIDTEIERVYLPVTCANCGCPNLLIAEDFVVVETDEDRGMGRENMYSPTFAGQCADCGTGMEAEVGFREYPKGILSILQVNNTENCKIAKDIGGLDSLIEDINLEV